MQLPANLVGGFEVMRPAALDPFVELLLCFCPIRSFWL
jgi:hypothetical protein